MMTAIESVHAADEAYTAAETHAAAEACATEETRIAALLRPPATVTKQHLLRVRVMMDVPPPMTTATENDPHAAFKGKIEL